MFLGLSDAKLKFLPLIRIKVLKIDHLIRRLPSPSDAQLHHIHPQSLDLFEFFITPTDVRHGGIAHNTDKVFKSSRTGRFRPPTCFTQTFETHSNKNQKGDPTHLPVYAPIDPYPLNNRLNQICYMNHFVYIAVLTLPSSISFSVFNRSTRHLYLKTTTLPFLGSHIFALARSQRFSALVSAIPHFRKSGSKIRIRT